MTKRVWLGVLAAAALVAASASAWAQGTCPGGQPGPTQITSNSYTLANTDQCKFLLFTGATPVTVTAPAASTLQMMTFQVTIMTTGVPLSIVSASSTINMQSQQMSVTGWQPVTLYGDNSNYWLVAVTPQPLAGGLGEPLYNPSSTAFLMPGTTRDASPILKMGNGLMRYDNQATWLQGSSPPWLGSTVCQGAPFGGQQPGRSWMMILDNFGIARYVPTC